MSNRMFVDCSINKAKLGESDCFKTQVQMRTGAELSQSFLCVCQEEKVLWTRKSGFCTK